jgi:uncharacterized protein YlxW (UPF0749 family)
MNSLAVALTSGLIRNLIDTLDIYHATSVSVNRSSSAGRIVNHETFRHASSG